MAHDRNTHLLAYHDSAARKTIEAIESLRGHAAGEGRRMSALARARARLAFHLTQHQLIADAEGLDVPRRDWMLRAVRSATDDALPALVRVLRDELHDAA